MNPWIVVVMVLGLGALFVAYLALRGVDRHRLRQLKLAKQSSDTDTRLARLERELSKLPVHAVSAEDLEAMEKRLAAVELGIKGLLPRDMAERMVNTHNQMLLHIEELREWMVTEQKLESLEEGTGQKR